MHRLMIFTPDRQDCVATFRSEVVPRIGEILVQGHDKYKVYKVIYQFDSSGAHWATCLYVTTNTD